MGRAFEFRKERKFKRWGQMAKTFTKIGKEMAIAIKEGGGDPAYNSRLRMAIQNAKAANMPKVNIENAIKRATSKDAEAYQEVVYEGVGPHGISLMVETQTDNPTRTVANIRMHFNKCGGTMGTFGSAGFLFKRLGMFRVKSEGLDMEELEFELIDAGLDSLKLEEDELVVYCEFTEFGTMQKALEERKIEVISAELVRIAMAPKQLTEEQVEDIIKLVDRLEDDEDVSSVFTTMDDSE